MQLADRFKRLSKGVQGEQQPIQENVPPKTKGSGRTLALNVPDFSQLNLAENSDYLNALADTIPPEHLEAEQLFEGCQQINAIRMQFELSVEARKLLMVIALVRWLRQFEAKGGPEYFNCQSMTEFVRSGKISSPDGKPLLLRSWHNYKRIVELFDLSCQEIRKQPALDQDSLTRRLLEIGPSKLNLLGKLEVHLGVSEFVNIALQLEEKKLPVFEGETVDPHIWSVTRLTSYVESLKALPQRISDPVLPMQRFRHLLSSFELEKVDYHQREAVRTSLMDLQNQISELLSRLNDR